MAERITGHTELIGLIATPIRHSMSPTMHNEAFAHLGLDYVYLAFEVGNQELKDVVQGFRAMKLRGFNVSMPNKTEICQYLIQGFTDQRYTNEGFPFLKGDVLYGYCICHVGIHYFSRCTSGGDCGA